MNSKELGCNTLSCVAALHKFHYFCRTVTAALVSSKVKHENSLHFFPVHHEFALSPSENS